MIFPCFAFYRRQIGECKCLIKEAKLAYGNLCLIYEAIARSPPPPAFTKRLRRKSSQSAPRNDNDDDTPPPPSCPRRRASSIPRRQRWNRKLAAYWIPAGACPRARIRATRWDGWIHPRILATASARVLQNFVRPKNKRDAGKTGCALHPRSHVPMHMQRKTHMSIQVQRKHSGLPCAMVLQLISCSPRRDLACLSPSPA